MRRIHDLDTLLDQLAVVRPAAHPESPGEETPVARHNVMSFVPEGERGVAAYVDGQKAASA